MEKKKPYKSANRDRAVQTYASMVLKKSSIGVVSSLAQTTSAKSKGLKVFFLILCLSGFVYQSGRFLMKFFQYPAVVDVDIRSPERFMVPAYTFCDNNGIKRSLFCKKFPDYCEEANEDFCRTYGSYCGSNKTLVPKKEYYMTRHHIAQEDIISLNSDLSDFLIENKNRSAEEENIEEAQGPYIRLKSKQYPHKMLCYSWNERVDSSSEPVRTSKRSIIRFPENIMTFYVEEDEVFIPGDQAGVLFSVHSPFIAENPFESGIFLKPGKTYVIYVTMELEMLLEKPYATDCEDYEELWRSNNYSGPRSKKMCIDKCLQELSMICFNCIVPLLLYPTNETLCIIDDLSKLKCPGHNLSECDPFCKDNCKETKYKYIVQERSSIQFDMKGNKIPDIDKKIIVEVYIEDNEVIIWEHSPKYLVVELFSTIGGFIGIWLGMSLLDITELVEGFFSIIRHSCKS